VYVPAVLDDGVIAPVVLLMVSPPGALNVPPVYAPVPDRVTDAELTDVQKGVPAKDIVAVGAAVIVTNVVAVTAAQPPAAVFV
jgi:hypothetical protein